MLTHAVIAEAALCIYIIHTATLKKPVRLWKKWYAWIKPIPNSQNRVRTRRAKGSHKNTQSKNKNQHPWRLYYWVTLGRYTARTIFTNVSWTAFCLHKFYHEQQVFNMSWPKWYQIVDELQERLQYDLGYFNLSPLRPRNFFLYCWVMLHKRCTK